MGGGGEGRGCRGGFGVPISLGESENISKLINRVIHKVRTLRGGRGAPAKSVLTRVGDGGGSSVRVRTL